MKQIISASRRTDIPAYYLHWFIKALQQGSVEVANPFRRTQIKTVDLRPDAVRWIVFWSRNYHTFLKRYQVFNDYQLFFHFTILPESKLERIALPWRQAAEQARRLAGLFGPERIIWRYDPLVYWQENGHKLSNHQSPMFGELCRALSDAGITRCYTSFATPCRKFAARFRNKFPECTLLQLSGKQQRAVLSDLAEQAAPFGITIFSCCNDALVSEQTVRKGHCIDGNLLNSLDTSPLVSTAKRPTRDQCNCTASVDIGDYLKQPCPGGCIYCYANPQWQ